MAEPSTNINYSFKDIQRYVQGKMSATEMHDIEKAALQDPFLADAIEGFNEADFTKAQQHLNEINTSLSKEKKESKVVAFNKKTRWLNVAALIIVLAGVGIVASYFFKSPNQQVKIAQVQTRPEKNKVLKDSVTENNVNATLSKQPDSTLLIAQNKAVKKSTSRKKITINNTHADTIKSSEENKTDVASITVAPVQLNQSHQSLIIDTVRNNVMSAKMNNSIDSDKYEMQESVAGLSMLPLIFSGKILDENGEPIPFATVRVSNKQSVVADATGNFSLKNKDTSLSVTTSAIGYTNNASVIKPTTQNVIVLNRNTSEVNDVVVTEALGVSKENKSAGYSSRSDSAHPVGGWENFNHYVLSQLNVDSTKQEDFYNDNLVELEFLIDDSGSPYNITVVKSLDDRKDSQAIDILKGGPKWTKARKNKKARVAISFKPQ